MAGEKSKPLQWVGDSKKQLASFPEDVRRSMGHALREAQMGRKVAYAKPFKGVDGVFEIVSDFDTDTYRAMYAVKLGDDIYVLSAFQKKSKTGKETPKHEVDLIKERYRRIKLLIDEAKKGKK